MLSAVKFRLHQTMFVDQHSSQTVSGRSALPKSKLNQSALPSEYFRRQFTAIFASHCALDAFDDG
ncbi:hypothetical protein CBM2586_A10303 [Cupriavidus phytorum]|uniref:Uncharacterized protein n=1 Tax=Cupriavidus taiwanensis TaxID=164546 RepID=A0A375B9L9_9BURK|nr:hypothetical protein CBM2586_A10303 [Cupriavidus taiwanensis]